MRPSKSKRKARIATGMQSTHVAILGVDVGGTFTDAVLLDGKNLRTAKVPTAERQEESVLAAARAVGMGHVERFAHGTTVATNALLERRGARTAFVTNAGFEHLLHLRRQTRAHLYRLCAAHPEPLVPLEGCFGVAGRMGTDGELEPLALDSLPEIDAEAVAVCLLHADRHPRRRGGADARAADRGTPHPAAERGHPPRRRRRRFAGLARPRRRAPRRATERRRESGARVLRPRRNPGDRDRCEPAARPPSRA